MTDRRKHIARVLATLTLAALGGTVLVAAPSTAEPDVDTVQARVDHLYHQAEQASERYNTAREDLRHAKVRLAAVRADVARQQTRTRDLRRRVAPAVVSRYQGQELSTTRVFLSDDPDAFLEQLTTVSQYADQQSQMMADFAAQAKQLAMRQEQAKRALGEVTGTVQQMAKDKAEIDRRAAQAKELLGKLKSEAAAKAAAAARAQTPSRDTTRPATPAPSAPAAAAPVSGRAGAAVDYALAQVGDAYVWGAAGPSAFDCSGLTMMAWQQAGVSLPHSSSAQSSSGTRVASSDLQPGDLVFYYSPISHVGMYIGNGKIVHAANPSSGVEISPVFSMPYSGAVRPG